jgi:hypothetical protein
MSALMQQVYDSNKLISPTAIANVFHITVEEVAGMTGIPKASLKRSDRFKSVKTQVKLKNALDIIALVTPWSGSELQAYAWYRSEPIPALGNITAESAVKMGQAQSVRDYIEGIALGGYA